VAGLDVDLDLDDLLTMTTRVTAFVTEFEELGGTTDEVENAVGRPGGRRELQGKVGDFESGWDGNREVILESLTNIRDHLTSLVEEFAALDVEMAKGGDE